MKSHLFNELYFVDSGKLLAESVGFNRFYSTKSLDSDDEV